MYRDGGTQIYTLDKDEENTKADLYRKIQKTDGMRETS